MNENTLQKCPRCGTALEAGFGAKAIGLSFVAPEKLEHFAGLGEIRAAQVAALEGGVLPVVPVPQGIPMSWLTKWLFREPPAPPYDRGVNHLKRAEYEQAIAAFTEAIQLEANAPNAYLGRALAYRSVGDEDSAIRDERTARAFGGAESSTWERLVNRAYQRLKGDLNQASRGEFYRRLEPLQRKAVLLWELNSQVLNGGIPQWVANGYGAQIDEVIGRHQDPQTNEAMIADHTALGFARPESKFLPVWDLRRSSHGPGSCSTCSVRSASC
jgi:tetratricopeptide (TPR) repeat protein